MLEKIQIETESKSSKEKKIDSPAAQIDDKVALTRPSVNNEADEEKEGKNFYVLDRQLLNDFVYPPFFE